MQSIHDYIVISETLTSLARQIEKIAGKKFKKGRIQFCTRPFGTSGFTYFEVILNGYDIPLEHGQGSVCLTVWKWTRNDNANYLARDTIKVDDPQLFEKIKEFVDLAKHNRSGSFFRRIFRRQ